MTDLHNPSPPKTINELIEYNYIKIYKNSQID